MCYVLKRVDGAGSHYLLRSEDFLATLEALSSYHVFLVFPRMLTMFTEQRLYIPPRDPGQSRSLTTLLIKARTEHSRHASQQ